MSSKNKYHPDVLLFVILIPFINAFNYYLTYRHITLSWYLLITFTIDTLQGYLAWWAVRSFIIYLDRVLPFEKGFAKRLTTQLIFTVIIALLIISTTTEAISFAVKGRPAPLSFYTVDLFIISTWFFVINGIYIGLYYYNLWQQSEERRLDESRMKSEGILVRQGKQELNLSFNEIVGFFVDGDYAVACTVDNKKFYMDQSLDKIEKTLPVSMFFRVNRQFILHRQSISGYTRAENGKIILNSLKNDNLQEEIVISRLKAPAFKTWFKGESHQLFRT